MVETTTLHYGWTKPEITHSASTWGGFLNNDLDAIDALVFANQQGIAPIGSITMFAGAVAPANWLICDGSSFPTTGTYAGLFAVLGTTYNQSGDTAGTFRVPNLTQKFPMGAGTLAATGGEATHTLTVAELPVVTPTQGSHTHAATQVAHTHADSGHTHTASQDPHSHTYHDTTNFNGFTGSFTNTAAVGQQTGTTSTQQPNVTVQAGAANLAAATPVITVPSVAPAINPFGGGVAHNTLPPYLTLNFIIRAQ